MEFSKSVGDMVNYSEQREGNSKARAVAASRRDVLLDNSFGKT
jgi:hypothetical protein